ncbi:four helix bundle protein [Desulfosporosinus metallidurans]|uniref:S23 ribosomal protein n=1 Tax=Desulfosporosinus metallidurans TaxID=1888891 RepID=A0A1Q8QFW4_9FIRM|nr:four helix bundle protein [Desulfosporosinus metallidurans]OLN26239.1 S23 ribosomal protein [Desulfosporosinus metallidurans]
MSKDNIPENVSIKDFKQLTVWQKAMELSDEVYRIVRDFPDFEKYAMTSQIVRATTSISANIAEGNGQLYDKKQFSFFNNALGSASEVRSWLDQAFRRQYIDEATFHRLDAMTTEVIKMILGYMKRLKAMVYSGKE